MTAYLGLSKLATTSGYLNPVKQCPNMVPRVRFCERAEPRSRCVDSPCSIIPKLEGRELPLSQIQSRFGLLLKVRQIHLIACCCRESVVGVQNG